MYLGTNVVVKNMKDNNSPTKHGGGKCLRTCASIVFSTIGVGAILISYIFCGAILFLTLEGNGECDTEKKNDLLEMTLTMFTIRLKNPQNLISYVGVFRISSRVQS